MCVIVISLIVQCFILYLCILILMDFWVSVWGYYKIAYPGVLSKHKQTFL
jgi:hypothetical protein